MVNCFLILVPIVFFVFIQSGNGFHFLPGQLKIENRDVIPDVVRIAGAGDYTYTFLQIPAENHLNYRFSMCCCKFQQYRIIQHWLGIAPPSGYQL